MRATWSPRCGHGVGMWLPRGGHGTAMWWPRSGHGMAMRWSRGGHAVEIWPGVAAQHGGTHVAAAWRRGEGCGGHVSGQATPKWSARNQSADTHVLQLSLVVWRWGTDAARPSLHGEVVVVRLVSVSSALGNTFKHSLFETCSMSGRQIIINCSSQIILSFVAVHSRRVLALRHSGL